MEITAAYRREVIQEASSFKDALAQEEAQLNQAIQNAGTPDDGTGSNGSNGSNLSLSN